MVGDVAPVVSTDSRYVFIVTDALSASGDVLPTEEAKFAWPVDDQGIVQTVDGPKSIDEVSQIVSSSSPQTAAHGIANVN